MPNADQPFDDAHKRRAEEHFQESIAHVTEKEIAEASRLGDEKAQRIEHDVPHSLGSLWRELKVLLALLRDYVQGNYREIPFGSMAAIAAAVLYFASPIDVIPDFIPGFGYIDDAAVLVLCLRLIQGDIEKYRQWPGATTD